MCLIYVYYLVDGGHPRAAGALIQGSVEEVKEKLMKEIKKWME